MKSFLLDEAGDYKEPRFGTRLLEVLEVLSLPIPVIKGSLLKKFHKEGCWGVKVLQPGHDDPKTEAIEFKLVGDSFDNALDLAMQELIGRLCGRHCRELKNHPSHSFGRRDEEVDPYELGNKENHSPTRQYLQDLEVLLSSLQWGRYDELLRNDELRAQLKEKDQKIKEFEELNKANEQKFEEQEKKFKNQEKRVQEKNKKIREQKMELDSNEVEFEVDHEMIDKLRAEKRVLEEKNQALATELQELKGMIEEAGFELGEEEVVDTMVEG